MMRTMKKKTEKTKKKTITGRGEYKEREREGEGIAYLPAQSVASPPLKRKDDDNDEVDDVISTAKSKPGAAKILTSS